MDSKIIEKVAIAIVNRERAIHGYSPILIKTMKSDHKNQWGNYLELAQAAISAIG